MLAILRRRQKLAKYCSLIIALSFLFVYISKSFGGISLLKRYNFKVQFYDVKRYVDMFDFLRAINVTVVVLDPAMMTDGEIADINFVTFGMFDAKVHDLKKALTSGKIPKLWTYEEHNQVDHRIYPITRVESLITTHYTFTSPGVGTLHLAVIYLRSMSYFWVSEFTDHKLGSRRFAIPMPMAIEAFKCNLVEVSDYHTFCVPDNRKHYIWQLQYADFVECHYDDVVWPFEKDFPHMKKIDTRTHAKGVQEMMRIGRKFEMPIVLAFGSLLGWYRQCDFLVESNNLEALMFVQDFSEELFRELWFSPVLRMYVRLGTLEEGLEFRFFSAATVWFDLFMMYHNRSIYNTYMIHTTLMELQRSTYPRLARICSAEWLGVLVYVPCDPLKYILAEYGPDGWYTPKGANYLNIDVVKKYETNADMYKNIHNYKKDCKYPSVAHGCDDIVETTIPPFVTTKNPLDTI